MLNDTLEITEKMHASVDNILTIYREASASQIARGIAWYADAHTFALSLSKDILESAGVIAALSPRIRWERNMVLAARLYVEGFASGTLTNNCRKAERIYNGEQCYAVLRGNKVRAFAATIINPSETQHVVIDRHALDVAIGRAASKQERAMLTNNGVYESLEALYRRAASIAGIPATQMQAITWLVWREGHAEYRKAARRAIA